MKILLVNDYGCPAYGSENLTLDLRELLRKRGHDARLFSTDVRTAPNQSVASDYQCHGSLSRLHTILQAGNPWAYFSLRRVLREFKPDVVHVRIFLLQLSPLILPLLRHVPSFYHIVILKAICPAGIKMLPDGSPCESRPGAACYRNKCFSLRSFPFAMAGFWLWKKWHSAFSMKTTNSHAMKMRLEAEGIKIDDVVWNAVPARAMRPVLFSPPTVVFAGRLAFEKGADILVRAFAQVLREVPEAELIMAGEGQEQRRLEEQIENLGISSRVRLTGHILPGEMEKTFDKAWVQVVPSRWDEPFGRTAAEAMMRGTAVIASDSGGLPEIVGHDGTRGLLVQRGDENALAQALLLLLKNKSLAEEMGRRGHAFATANLGQDAYLDKILGIYRRVGERWRDRTYGTGLGS